MRGASAVVRGLSATGVNGKCRVTLPAITIRPGHKALSHRDSQITAAYLREHLHVCQLTALPLYIRTWIHQYVECLRKAPGHNKFDCTLIIKSLRACRKHVGAARGTMGCRTAYVPSGPTQPCCGSHHEERSSRRTLPIHVTQLLWAYMACCMSILQINCLHGVSMRDSGLDFHFLRGHSNGCHSCHSSSMPSHGCLNIHDAFAADFTEWVAHGRLEAGCFHPAKAFKVSHTRTLQSPGKAVGHGMVGMLQIDRDGEPTQEPRLDFCILP